MKMKLKMKNKKGIELSLNIVIIGIILLIVMVIILYIFSTQMSNQGGVLDRLTGNVSEATDGDGDASEFLDRFKPKESTGIIPIFFFPLKNIKNE